MESLNVLPLHTAIMPPMKRSRDIERHYRRDRFVAKLRRLADALEKGGAFTIQVAGERLRIPSGAEFNIEHERASGKNELEFQLRWEE
jgi:amphi-Trp domain-containing protein